MQAFQNELLSHLDGNAKDILDELRTKGSISAELEKRLFDSVTAFKKSFVASHGS
jgi:F0F1-type ATP synthase alpha subunit